VLAGAGVRKRGHVEAARSEDVGVTLRLLTGLPVEPNVHGKAIDGAMATYPQ
jgi:hypothetical protein